MESNIQKKQQPQSSLAQFKSLLGKDDIKRKFDEALGKKAPMFASNLITIVSTNSELQKCEHMSIISSALMATSMDLPLVPGLGIAAIVPYWDNKKKEMKSQFQIMKKGYIQLAQRTGLFKRINATEVYEGELVEYDRFTGAMVFDAKAKKSEKVIGYVSYFKLINGFESYYYMTIHDLEKHAKMYSKSYIKGYGKWADKEGSGFHQMCLKTVLKLNLSSYAPLSTDINMQKSIIYDQAEIKDMEGKDYEYIDNDNSEIPSEQEVINIDDRQVVIDKSRQQKSQDITQKTAETVKRQGDGMKFTEEQLKTMDITLLMSIISKEGEMNDAVIALPGTNTNKKLRGIILAHQDGRLEELMDQYASDDVKNEPVQEEAKKDISPNTDFENETVDNTTNKFGIYISDIPEGSEKRDFESARTIYQAIAEKGLTNPKYNDMKGGNGVSDDIKVLVGRFRNRDEFCKSATTEEINMVLNSL